MSQAPHIPRPAPKRLKPAPATPARAYPPGFFSELVRQHNWPPMFESQFIAGRDTAVNSLSAQKQRQAGNHAWEAMPLNLAGAAEHVERWKGKA